MNSQTKAERRQRRIRYAARSSKSSGQCFYMNLNLASRKKKVPTRQNTRTRDSQGKPRDVTHGASTSRTGRPEFTKPSACLPASRPASIPAVRLSLGTRATRNPRAGTGWGQEGGTKGVSSARHHHASSSLTGSIDQPQNLLNDTDVAVTDVRLRYHQVGLPIFSD